MKVILDIKDDKAAFFMEVLKNFSFVKAKPLTPYKEEVLQGLKEARVRLTHLQYTFLRNRGWN
jgi:hypothetical protein